jgi:guanyl-specific ribonuclease Sa
LNQTRCNYLPGLLEKDRSAMSDYVLIGPVLLQGFELPDHISWGGEQRLVVHRLPGGGRIIDSLGRDDADITWSGVFTGADAGLRARLIDLMRAGGRPWPLTWSSFFYSVVIKSLDVDYRKENWLPYRLTCTVARDEVEAIVETVLSTAETVLADLASASSIGVGIDFNSAMTAIGEIGAATFGTAANINARSSLAGANSAIEHGIANQQAILTGTPFNSARDIVNWTNAAGQLASFTSARGYVRRAQVNTEGPTG